MPVSLRLAITVVAVETFSWSSYREMIQYTKYERDECTMGVFQKAFRSVNTGSSAAVFEDTDFAARYPVLFAFLAQETDDQGAPRKTSTLMILVEGGQAKGCLKDRDHDVSLWRSSSSILGVLEALEDGLTGEVVDWRTPYKPSNRR